MGEQAHKQSPSKAVMCGCYILYEGFFLLLSFFTSVKNDLICKQIKTHNLLINITWGQNLSEKKKPSVNCNYFKEQELL